MKKIRVFLADDHAIVRDGLKLLVNGQADMEVIGMAGDGNTAWREVKALQPDIVVMDVSMPELNGAQATERLTASCPNIKVIALTAHSDAAHVRQLLASGVCGYILKNTVSEELTNAIRSVMRGGVYLDPAIAGKVASGFVNLNFNPNGAEALSAREHEVLIDVARGYTNKEIAERMHLSVKTIEGHKARAMEKFNFRSRAEVVRYALQQGWLQNE